MKILSQLGRAKGTSELFRDIQYCTVTLLLNKKISGTSLVYYDENMLPMMLKETHKDLNFVDQKSGHKDDKQSPALSMVLSNNNAGLSIRLCLQLSTVHGHKKPWHVV